MNIEEDAYRYAVKNAFEHKGQAQIGALIGKLKALHSDKDVSEIMPIVTETVKKVNSMSAAEIEEAFKDFEGGYELKPKQGREGLAPLDWAEKGGKVVTRFAPNPNGPAHLGHARAFYLSYAYAKMYNGKFILRFEDTDPKVKKPIENAEALFLSDLGWFGIKPDEIYFASDRMEIYYEYMRKLIEMDKAYACFCESEKWRTLTKERKACPHRDIDAKKQLAEFEKMVSNETKEGEAVLRIKTDLDNPDPSVRDWWVARIVDSPKHPRIKKEYHVWPSYMFQSAVDDYLMGITFILRGQEHSQNQTKQEYLCKYFGWGYPHAVHFGRMSAEGMILSTSKIREGIEAGIYTGWDDIRLGTIQAIRRRGFSPKAIEKIIEDSGLTTSDAKFSMQKLSAYNKEFIQGKARRETFIDDPIKLTVASHEELEFEKDGKTFVFKRGLHEFFVSKKEVVISKGHVVRLRNAYNIKIDSVDDFSVQGNFAGTDAKGKLIVPWIQEMADLELHFPDGTKKAGAIEKQELEKGQYLYFDKIGFFIVDSVSGKRPIAWFTHE